MHTGPTQSTAGKGLVGHLNGSQPPQEVMNGEALRRVVTVANPQGLHMRPAAAFAKAVEAGRLAFEAGLIEPRDMASPSTPVAGTPFFKIDHAS